MATGRWPGAAAAGKAVEVDEEEEEDEADEAGETDEAGGLAHDAAAMMHA
jgi:hypothetical protein